MDKNGRSRCSLTNAPMPADGADGFVVEELMVLATTICSPSGTLQVARSSDALKAASFASVAAVSEPKGRTSVLNPYPDLIAQFQKGRFPVFINILPVLGPIFFQHVKIVVLTFPVIGRQFKLTDGLQDLDQLL